MIVNAFEVYYDKTGQRTEILRRDAVIGPVQRDLKAFGSESVVGEDWANE